MLANNGTTITTLQRDVGRLHTEVKRVERFRDDGLARIEDLVHDVDTLQAENHSLKASVGINEPLVIKRHL